MGDGADPSAESLECDTCRECKRKECPMLDGVVGDSMSATESSSDSRPWLSLWLSSKKESLPSRKKVCMSRLNLREWLVMGGS